MKYTREDRLRLSNEMLAGEAWKMLESELKTLVDIKEKEIQGYLVEANTHKSFLHEGIKIGLQIAMAMPGKMQKDNELFFKRLYDKITA